MNPVNRQYLEMANLFQQTDLAGIHCCSAGLRSAFLSRSRSRNSFGIRPFQVILDINERLPDFKQSGRQLESHSLTDIIRISMVRR